METRIGNFDLLLQNIQQNKQIKLGLGESDKLNNEQITLLAEALVKNTSVKIITIVYEQYLKNIGDGILFKAILEKLKNNEMEELTFILNLSVDKISLLTEVLKKNTSLVKLTIADGLLCESMPLIAKLLKYNKTLLHLNLDCNFSKDESVIYLCEMLRENCTLKSLSLQDNHFSAESIKLLAKTVRYFNQSLINLNLNNNPGSHILKNKTFCHKLSFKYGFFKRENFDYHTTITKKKLHANESFDNKHAKYPS